MGTQKAGINKEKSNRTFNMCNPNLTKNHVGVNMNESFESSSLYSDRKTPKMPNAKMRMRSSSS